MQYVTFGRKMVKFISHMSYNTVKSLDQAGGEFESKLSIYRISSPLHNAIVNPHQICQGSKTLVTLQLLKTKPLKWMKTCILLCKMYIIIIVSNFM